VGVLVQAQVGHQHGVRADLGGQPPQRHLHDPGRVVRGRTAAVLRRRHAEQDQPADTRRHRLVGGLHERVEGVLHDARHGRDRRRGVDALLDEPRQDQVARVQPHVRDEPAQRRGPPQPARPGGRERAHRAVRLVDEARRLFFGGGVASPDSRFASAYAASASTSVSTAATSGSTSERSPNSRAVAAVCGPMQATTVRACGLPAMPTRLRTVEDDVKRTASNPPDLIASRISAGGGAARTVRYAVTSSTSQPRSVSPAASVSVAMSARGSSTLPTGSSSSSCGANSASRPSLVCSPIGTSSGWMPKPRTASAVASPMQAIFTPPKWRASRPCSANFSHTALTALTLVNTVQAYRPSTRPLMARSICAGVRGGSTAIVGTSHGIAPYARSRSLIAPACSLVRGTSTFQPYS